MYVRHFVRYVLEWMVSESHLSGGLNTALCTVDLRVCRFMFIYRLILVFWFLVYFRNFIGCLGHVIGGVIDELRGLGLWKEAIVNCFKVLPRLYLTGLAETSAGIAGLRVEIWSREFSSKKHKLVQYLFCVGYCAYQYIAFCFRNEHYLTSDFLRSLLLAYGKTVSVKTNFHWGANSIVCRFPSVPVAAGRGEIAPRVWKTRSLALGCGRSDSGEISIRNSRQN
jgi:hypothetical protein